MNIKKIVIVATLPAFVFVLAGCGQSTPQSATPQKNKPATSSDQQDMQNQSTGKTRQADQLPPLPSDSKTAIDQEVKGIDQDLQSTPDDTNQNDLSNSQFGL
jgi:hypothetical protein